MSPAINVLGLLGPSAIDVLVQVRDDLNVEVEPTTHLRVGEDEDALGTLEWSKLQWNLKRMYDDHFLDGSSLRPFDCSKKRNGAYNQWIAGDALVVFRCLFPLRYPCPSSGLRLTAKHMSAPERMLYRAQREMFQPVSRVVVVGLDVLREFDLAAGVPTLLAVRDIVIGEPESISHGRVRSWKEGSGFIDGDGRTFQTRPYREPPLRLL